MPTTRTSPNLFATAKLRTWPMCTISKHPLVETIFFPALRATVAARSTSLNFCTLLMECARALDHGDAFLCHNAGGTVVGKRNCLLDIIHLGIAHHERRKKRVPRPRGVLDLDLLAHRIQSPAELRPELALGHNGLSFERRRHCGA